MASTGENAACMPHARDDVEIKSNEIKDDPKSMKVRSVREIVECDTVFDFCKYKLDDKSNRLPFDIEFETKDGNVAVFFLMVVEVAEFPVLHSQMLDATCKRVPFQFDSRCLNLVLSYMMRWYCTYHTEQFFLGLSFDDLIVLGKACEYYGCDVGARSCRDYMCEKVVECSDLSDAFLLFAKHKEGRRLAHQWLMRVAEKFDPREVSVLEVGKAHRAPEYKASEEFWKECSSSNGCFGQ